MAKIVKLKARQIMLGCWKFNGDVIKISADGDVLDGQHRLSVVPLDEKTMGEL